MTETLERYKLEIVNNHGDRYIRCDPAPDGSWVMFRDVATMQKRCEEAERERDALRRDASQEIATDELVRRLQHLGDWQAADRIEALQKRIAELEAALRFYEDPFKYTDIHGDDVRVPHFYSETDFGETARVALKGGKNG